MTTSLHILGRALRDLGRSFIPLLGYDLLFRVASAAVVAPLSALIVRGLVRTTGRYAVGNKELAAFLLSPVGLLVLIVSGVLTLFLIFLEHAGLILIGHEAAHGRRLSALAAFRATVWRLPALLELGCRQVGFYALLAVPFLVPVGLAYGLLWSEFDLYYLTTLRPPRFWVGAGIAALAGAAYAVVALRRFLRWLIALPTLLVEKVGAAEALRLSAARTRGSNGRNLAVLALGSGGVLILSTSATALFVKGSDALLDAIGTPKDLIPLIAALLAAHVVLAALLSFLGTALSALSILEIDRETRARAGLADPAAPAIRPPLPDGGTRTRTVALGVLVVIGGLATATTYGLIESLDVRPRIEITAHRGDSSRAPENSLAAIRSAIAAGADYAEIDVQLSSDGAVVVVHDEDLRRIAGDPRRVRELTLTELQGVDAGAFFAPEFRGERIPTLPEVLDAAGDRIGLNIELKFPPGRHAPGPLVDAVIAALDAADPRPRCIVTSLSFPALEQVRRRAPGFRIGSIIFEAVGDPSRLDADFLSVRDAVATDDLIAAARRRGKPVHVWKIDNPDRLATLINRGVANVITDIPAAMVERRAELESLNDFDRLLLWYREALAR